MAKVIETNIEQLVPDNKNFNKGTEYGQRLIEESLRKFGAGRSILIDKNNRIIAGNKTIENAANVGLENVIVVETDGNQIVAVKRNDIDLDSAKGRELALADNATGKANLEWDEATIAEAAAQWNIDPMDWGVTMNDGDEEEEPEEIEAEEDNFDTENASLPKDRQTKLGDVWLLGEHRLLCGDSTSKADVEKLLNGKKADLVFTDPPYGMKKEKEGVLNDNLNYNDLLIFNKQWIPLTFESLKDNGSWYCWGIDEPLMDIYSEILKPMQRENKITFRNIITWDKGCGQGQLSKEFRMYPIADEKCLFVMCGTWEKEQDGIIDWRKPIAEKIAKKAKQANLTNSKMQELIGHSQKSPNHFTNYKLFRFPALEYWIKWFNGCEKEYETLKKEYETLKQEAYSTRAYFDNTHDNMNSVWHFERTTEQERKLCGGHATPKPIALCGRAIKSSSRINELVLDVFGGSGSTLIACEQLKRKCNMMELDPHYCDVIVNRWETLTGKTAIKRT